MFPMRRRPLLLPETRAALSLLPRIAESDVVSIGGVGERSADVATSSRSGAGEAGLISSLHMSRDLDLVEETPTADVPNESGRLSGGASAVIEKEAATCPSTSHVPRPGDEDGGEGDGDGGLGEAVGTCVGNVFRLGMLQSCVSASKRPGGGTWPRERPCGTRTDGALMTDTWPTSKQDKRGSYGVGISEGFLDAGLRADGCLAASSSGSDRRVVKAVEGEGTDIARELEVVRDENALAGFTIDGLRHIGVCEGALVIVKSLANGVARLAITTALDSSRMQNASLLSDDGEAHDGGHKIDGVNLPETSKVIKTQSLLANDVAYLSPMLAFNLQLHLQLRPDVVLPSAPMSAATLSSASPSTSAAHAASCQALSQSRPHPAKSQATEKVSGMHRIGQQPSSFHVEVIPYFPKGEFPKTQVAGRISRRPLSAAGESGSAMRASLTSVSEIERHENIDQRKKGEDMTDSLSAILPPHATLVRVSCIPIPKRKPAVTGLDLQAVVEDASFIEKEKLPHGSGDNEMPGRDAQRRNIDACICDYFAGDRFLSKGDVFAVPVIRDSSAGTVIYTAGNLWGEAGNEDTTTKETVYFYKVLSLVPSNEPFVRVQKDRSTLMLAGTATSLLPTREDILGDYEPGQTSTSTLQPSATKDIAVLLAPLLHPFTAPLGMRTSILLWGPQGAGKRTAARAAATSLGMRVVEVNCYNLLRSSDAKMASTLTQAFKTAACYSPSVLLLRRFSALAKSSAPGNAPNHGFPPSSQVSVALKRGIQMYALPFARRNEELAASDVQAVISGQNQYCLSDYTCDKVGGSEFWMRHGDDSFRLEMDGSKRALVIVIAAVERADGLPVALRRCFTHEIAVKPPDEKQRLELLRGLLLPNCRTSSNPTDDSSGVNGTSGYSSDSYGCLNDEEGTGGQDLEDQGKAASSYCDEDFLTTVASQTVGLVRRDIQALVADAAMFAAETTFLESEDGRWNGDDDGKSYIHGEAASLRGWDNGDADGVNGEKTRDMKIGEPEIGGKDVMGLESTGYTNLKSQELLARERDKKEGKRGMAKSSIEITKKGGRCHSSKRLLRVLPKDVEKALTQLKLRTASKIGTPKVPNVKWEDVGGLDDVKAAILDTVELPLKHRDLFSSGLRQRSGILLYGPPGTGKTLLAKAVATECSLNFLSVKGPELINMYIGESEKNVREIFETARDARPCVLFFDELDALAPARGASGDSGGVMDRVVSQMLAEIDGLQGGGQDLFIIGASNRPDLIDPALMRPGRFDKLLYVGVSVDVTQRVRVLEALTNKFKLDADVDLLSVAKRCPPNFTGADVYGLCADAWMQAVKRKVDCSKSSDEDGLEGNGDDGDVQEEVVVKLTDFKKAFSELTPSLSMGELERYNQLRMQFEGQRATRRS